MSKELGSHSRVITYPVYQTDITDYTGKPINKTTVTITKTSEQVNHGVIPMFDKMEVANKRSKTSFEFGLSACSIICNSTLLMVLLFLSALCSIVIIIMGSVFFNDCPYEPLIPIWLVVYGVVSFVSAVLSLFFRIWDKRMKTVSKNYVMSNWFLLKYILDLFLFAWLITGSVWVYGTYYTVQFTKNFSRYCHQDVYLFAFSVISILWILIGIAIFFIICGIPLLCLFFRKPKPKQKRAKNAEFQ